MLMLKEKMRKKAAFATAASLVQNEYTDRQCRIHSPPNPIEIYVVVRNKMNKK